MSEGYTVVDLFSGAGGLSLGFDLCEPIRRPFRVISGIDIDATSLHTFYQNHPEADQTFSEPTDLRKISGNDILRTVGVSSVEVVVGGPPCQGFSHAGPRNPFDDRNALIWDFARLVGELRPLAFLMENVPGLLKTRKPDEDPFIQQLLSRFRSLGYSPTVCEVNAMEYGVPQNRRRVFILGMQDGERIEKPLPTHGPRESIYGKSQALVTSGEAILDLPTPNGNGPQPYDKPSSSEYQRAMRKDSEAIHNHIPAKHGPAFVERLRKQQPGTRLYKNWNHSWYRLDPSKPSPTVKENHRAPFVHPVEPRVTTPRECARLQSFPDRFVFAGPKSSQLRQIGNAVPPLLAKAFAQSILASMR